MRIGKVIGTVTPGRIHSELQTGQFKIIKPFTYKDLIASTLSDSEASEFSGESGEASVNLLLKGVPQPSGEEVVAFDDLSVGIGEWVAFSEGAEAAMAFYPNVKPVDVYAAAIIDTVEIDEAILASVKR